MLSVKRKLSCKTCNSVDDTIDTFHTVSADKVEVFNVNELRVIDAKCKNGHVGVKHGFEPNVKGLMPPFFPVSVGLSSGVNGNVMTKSLDRVNIIFAYYFK